MAVGDRIGVADKETLDKTKKNTDDILNKVSSSTEGKSSSFLTAGIFKWTVPPGVNAVQVSAIGGAGGGGGGGGRSDSSYAGEAGKAGGTGGITSFGSMLSVSGGAGGSGGTSWDGNNPYADNETYIWCGRTFNSGYPGKQQYEKNGYGGKIGEHVENHTIIVTPRDSITIIIGKGGDGGIGGKDCKNYGDIKTSTDGTNGDDGALLIEWN